jgi:hypothetical protein
MPRRISVGMTLAGIGWWLAETPSVWRLVAYLIPAFALCLLIVIILKIFKTESKE